MSLAQPRQILPLISYLLDLCMSAGDPILKAMHSEETQDEGDSDADLYISYQQGNNHAFQFLFHRWKLPLISFFYRSLGNREDAEELALDVFRKLHQSDRRFERKARFPTFLFTIARRLLLNKIRSKRRKPLEIIDPGDLLYIQNEAESSNAITAEQEQIMIRALDELEEKYRTPLLLTLQQGLQPREISKIISKSENSTRVLLHRAKIKLRQILEQRS